MVHIIIIFVVNHGVDQEGKILAIVDLIKMMEMLILCDLFTTLVSGDNNTHRIRLKNFRNIYTAPMPGW